MTESRGSAWACPACTFRSRSAAGLSDHVSGAHFVTDGTIAGSGSWRCPAGACDSRVPLRTAREFLAHLDQHMFGRVKVEPPPRRPTPRAPAATKPSVPRTPPNLLQEPPVGDEGEPTRLPAWRCPACPYVAANADGLAGHVRLVHVRLTYQDEAPTAWACPNLGCGSKHIESAKDLAKHLEAHAIQQPVVAPRRRGRHKQPRRPCSVSGCEAPFIARGLCLRHYRSFMRMRQRGEGRDGVT